jgi:uncharacterized NAD(P)/FAD-binding protein YdhS
MGHRLSTVAIIGAGASGVLTALQVLAPPGEAPASLVLIERSKTIGAGVAYSTTQESHLLNVPAASMSAFSRDPGHFVRWLDRHGLPDAGGAFVPRFLYGRYLRDTMGSLARSGGSDGAIEVLHDEVLDIEVRDGVPWLVPGHGYPGRVDAVVLATGVVASRFPPELAAADGHERCVVNPWLPGALDRLSPRDTVTLIGTGLSAVDALLTLADKGQQGPVHAISRRGWLPAAHTAVYDPSADLAHSVSQLEGATARGLLHEFRQEVARARVVGADWREVVDLLRPRVPELWHGLNGAEQRRFKRHLERLWNVHRHRMAPQVASRVEQLRDAGIFNVHAGEVLSFGPSARPLRLNVKLRSTGLVHSWDTDWLVNCTGPGPVVFGDGQTIMNRLRARGLVIPGAHGIGVATSAQGRVLDAAGDPVNWLWAIGPLRQGQLYESTAVPEIRSQAQEVAAQLQRMLAATEPVDTERGTAALATAV